jgi:Cu2+-exporting ATPase
MPLDRSRRISARREPMLLRLAVAALGMMQVMMYASTVYFAGGDMSADIERLMRWASLMLDDRLSCSIRPRHSFLMPGATVRNSRVGMDVPVALGIGVAFAASVGAMLTGEGEVYYDSITMFVFFLLLARFLESSARIKVTRGVEQLARLVPAIAERVRGFPRDALG